MQEVIQQEIKLSEESIIKLTVALKSCNSGINKKYLTLKEAAEYLRISYESLYRLIKNNKISVHKPTGKVLFTISDLDNFMAQGRISSKSEAVSRAINKVYTSVHRKIKL